jgi:16S rRNA (uracil1498-N3)-methyltransferase
LYSFYNQEINNKTITGDLYNHIIKSLRFKEGDCFYFFDEINEYFCAISSIGKNFASYEIKTINKIVEKNKPFITLIQGVPKGEKMDFVCKYATLFNVDEIIFVYMSRSIPKDINQTNKLLRLNNIILEAVSISKRRSVPKVSFVNNLKDINLSKYDNVYLLDEEEKTTKEIKRRSSIAIIVGPEGGIDEVDRNNISVAYERVSLGTNILTTESASLAVLALFLTNK